MHFCIMMYILHNDIHILYIDIHILHNDMHILHIDMHFSLFALLHIFFTVLLSFIFLWLISFIFVYHKNSYFLSHHFKLEPCTRLREFPFFLLHKFFVSSLTLHYWYLFFFFFFFFFFFWKTTYFPAVFLISIKERKTYFLVVSQVLAFSNYLYNTHQNKSLLIY